MQISSVNASGSNDNRADKNTGDGESNPRQTFFFKRSDAMKVTRTDAVKMFEAMGIKTASKWNDARLSGKLAKVSTMVDEDTELADPASKKLLDAVLAANEAEEEIELAEAGEKTSTKKGKKKAAEAETTDAPVEKTSKKSTKPETTEKPAKAAKNGKPKAKTDEDGTKSVYGHRAGTQAATIDDMLFKGGTMKKMVSATGSSEGRIKGHINHLRKDHGLKVEETDGVWMVRQ